MVNKYQTYIQKLFNAGSLLLVRYRQTLKLYTKYYIVLKNGISYQNHKLTLNCRIGSIANLISIYLKSLIRLC